MDATGRIVVDMVGGAIRRTVHASHGRELIAMGLAVEVTTPPSPESTIVAPMHSIPVKHETRATHGRRK